MTYEEDVERLDELHDLAYDGKPYDAVEMKELWHRISKAPETEGTMVIMLLMYTSKYFPHTKVL